MKYNIPLKMKIIHKYQYIQFRSFHLNVTILFRYLVKFLGTRKNFRLL